MTRLVFWFPEWAQWPLGYLRLSSCEQWCVKGGVGIRGSGSGQESSIVACINRELGFFSFASQNGDNINVCKVFGVNLTSGWQNVARARGFFAPLAGKLSIFMKKFFGSHNIFWTVGSVVSKLSGNVGCVMCCGLVVADFDSALSGAGSGAFLANFEFFFF